jgi:multidrug efflux system membrane fusion protein
MHARFRLPAVLALLLPLAGCGSGKAEPTAPPPPEVTVAEVLIQELHDWDEFTGRLEAVEAVDIRPRVSGFIESVEFEEGARIQAGDLLFQIDPRPFQAQVDRLIAEQKRAQAQLDLARTNHARARRLLEQNATSREQFDSVATLEATASAELGAVGAALEAAQLDLEFTRVTSPIDGRVSRALITTGNLVDGSSLLTTVVSDDPIYAAFDADEPAYLRYAGLARGGASAEPANRVFVGLIDEQGYPHEGRLDFVDNRVDPDSGTIRGRAVLDNPDERFTPGLFVRIKLVGRGSYPAALVDDRAIGTDLGRRFVLVLDDQNLVQYRAVETGRLVDGLRIVRSGLEAGDVIVVNGLQRVRPGTPVSPTRVAMVDGARPEFAQVSSRPAVLAGRPGVGDQGR